MYESLAKVFSISIQQMKDYMKENVTQIVECGYDEYTVEQIDIAPLLKINSREKVINMNEIMVHHITPRMDVEGIKNEGLMTLPHALTMKTTLSNYLADLGYRFSFSGNKLCMEKNGERVDISKLEPSNLLMRLGGKYSWNDFNVNGYLFVTQFKIADCRGWLGSPEILKSLSNAYGDKKIADNYAEKCKNYLVSFRVPIEQIDITGYDDDISEENKTVILAKCSINALACMERNPDFTEEIYNPIIMLKRNFDVQGNNIEKIWSFKYTYTTIIPEDTTEIQYHL